MTTVKLLQVAAGICCAAMLGFGATAMQTGKAQLKSAGALAVGPDGVLFVGDSVGAAIFALDVNDKTPAHGAGMMEVKGINEKIAAMLGTAARSSRRGRTTRWPSIASGRMSTERPLRSRSCGWHNFGWAR